MSIEIENSSPTGAPFNKAKFDELNAKIKDLTGLFDASGDKLMTMNSSDEAIDIDAYKMEAKTYNVIKDKLVALEQELANEKAKDVETLDLATQVKKSDTQEAWAEYVKSKHLGVDIMKSPDMATWAGDGGNNIPAGSFFFKPDLDMSQNAARSDNATGQNAVATVTQMGNPLEALKYGGSVATMANVIDSGTGAPLVIPTSDQTAKQGSAFGISGQTRRTPAGQGSTAPDNQPANIGKLTLNDTTVTSGIIRVTMEMIQDGVFPYEDWALRQAVRWINRFLNEVYTNGLSDTYFEGLTEKAKDGVTTAAADKIAIKEIVKLTYSVDEAYKRNSEGFENGFNNVGSVVPGAGTTGFMLNISVEEMLVGMVDNDGRPLFLPSLSADKPNTIRGYPYVINNDLDAVAASAVPMLFGAFQYFAIRNIAELAMYKFFDASTAKDNEMHIMGFARRASKHVAPLSSDENAAIAKLTMHA